MNKIRTDSGNRHHRLKMESSASGKQGSPGRLLAVSGYPPKLICQNESMISFIMSDHHKNSSVDEVRGLRCLHREQTHLPWWRSGAGVPGADSLFGEVVLVVGYQWRTTGTR